jgi:hypothetical protein
VVWAKGVSRVPLDFAAFSRLTSHYHEQDVLEYPEVEASVKQVLEKRAETLLPLQQWCLINYKVNILSSAVSSQWSQ